MDERLMCLETQRELRAQPDHVLLQGRVLMTMLQTEHRYLPSPSYFQCVQKEVYPYMRKMLTSWMLEVCENQKCADEVFLLAVNCLDRVLTLEAVEKKKLQLLGSSCLLLASKLRDTRPMTTESLCMFADFCFTDGELRTMELLVLNKLKWDLESITPRDFLPHFLILLNIPPEKMPQVQKHTETFIALCTTDCNFIALPPSVVAAASMAAAVTGLRLEDLGMPLSLTAAVDRLAQAVHCDPNVIRMWQDQIEHSLRSNLQQPHREPDTKFVEEMERSGTPTDVLDFGL
ncbi:G1/S-specific cyclin-D1-like [Pelodytes ibericus]